MGGSDSGSSAAADDHRHHHPSAMHACRRRCKKINAGSISNLCSATLGAGALSLPFAISLAGIVFGILLLLFSAYLTIVSIDVIIEACRRTRLFKYEDVSVRLAGKGAARVLEASLLIFCFGTAVAYIVAVGDILDQGLKSIPYTWGSSLTAMYSRERIMILFWALIMFPLSLQRNVEALERFSSLGVLSIIFLVIAAVIHSVTHGVVIGEDRGTQQTPQTDISTMLWPKSFWDIIQAFPIIIFAFSCQVNVCAIYEELSTDDTDYAIYDAETELKAKQRAMKHITRKGVMLCVTLYICIGLFGFLDFSHGTVDNILNNYCIQQSHDPLMIAASAFVAVAVVVAFPFNILPARVTLKLILERMRKRRRCGSCHRFFSSIICSNCISPWAGLKRRGSNGSSEEDSANASSPRSQYGSNDDLENEQSADVTEPLLEEERFGDGPNLVPHMSLEGIPITIQEEEVYSTESPPIEHFLLTLLLSGGALVVALLIPGISVVFGLMGGTAASIISFILPGMFLMEANGDNGMRQRKVLPLLFVWGGTSIGVLSTAVTIYGIFSSSDGDVAYACGGLAP